MSGYSEACSVCQLYTRSPYYKANVLHGYEHLKPAQMEGKFVVVVGGAPEHHGGYYPPETNGTQFLFDILKRLTVPYAVTSVLKCDPAEYYQDKVKLKVAHHCCAIYTWEDVLSLHRQGKLGCVVCLGSNAMATILPDSKLRVDQAKHGIHWIGEKQEIPVLVTNAPSVHFQSYDDGGKDLRPEYVSVFGLANRIATGEYQKPCFHIDRLKTQTWDEVGTWLAMNPDYFQATHIVLDVESNINVNIKERCTVFHPATKILCFVIRYRDSSGLSKSVVIRTRDLDKPTVYSWIKYLVLGCGVPKKVGGSNILFDLCHILSCSLPLTVEEPLDFFRQLPGIHDYYQFHFLMDQGRVGNGQKDLVTHYFREPDYSVAVKDAIAALKKSGIKHPDYGDLDPDFLEEYCGLDGAWGGELLDLCLGKMEDEDHERYVPYMAKMDEIRGATLSSLLGIPVDLNHFLAAQQRAEASIKETSAWLDKHPFVAHAGYEVCNTKSVKLMNTLAEYTIHYHPHVAQQLNKTPSGLWQVSGDAIQQVLSQVSGDIGKLWAAIDENRSKRDFISKSLDMPLYYATHIYQDGVARIHPMWKISKSDFNQQAGEIKEGKSEGTDTSRWASEPNMQNIMARGDQAKVAEVRRGYIARPGFTLVNSDLKTIEPVLLAWLSGSQRMKDIFLLGVHEPKNPYADYYRNLGAHFFKVVDPHITPDKVTKAMRVVAKNDILLALQYGRSPHALSQVLGCTYEQADTLLKQFFYELYPEVHRAYEAVRHAVFYGQMVVTVTGTRQRFPLQQLYDYNREVDYWTLPYDLTKKLNVSGHDGHMLRKAWNFVHQGPAAQINNSGLVALHDERIVDAQLAQDLAPISSVHDAIVSEITTPQLQEIVDRMVTILYNPQRLDDLGFNFGFTEQENPLRGEVKAGSNYFDMEEMEWKRV